MGAAVGQLAMAGALSQIWGMINGMQVLVHMPIFAADIPGLSMTIIKAILSVACFDLPSINAADLAYYAEKPQEMTSYSISANEMMKMACRRACRLIKISRTDSWERPLTRLVTAPSSPPRTWDLCSSYRSLRSFFLSSWSLASLPEGAPPAKPDGTIESRTSYAGIGASDSSLRLPWSSVSASSSTYTMAPSKAAGP